MSEVLGSSAPPVVLVAAAVAAYVVIPALLRVIAAVLVVALVAWMVFGQRDLVLDAWAHLQVWVVDVALPWVAGWLEIPSTDGRG